jgi:hypothetical protein
VDEFGRIWLFGVHDLLVRTPRKVPTEDETLLGEFVLKKMTQINKAQTSSKPDSKKALSKTGSTVSIRD